MENQVKVQNQTQSTQAEKVTTNVVTRKAFLSRNRKHIAVQFQQEIVRETGNNILLSASLSNGISPTRKVTHIHNFDQESWDKIHGFMGVPSFEEMDEEGVMFEFDGTGIFKLALQQKGIEIPKDFVVNIEVEENHIPYYIGNDGNPYKNDSGVPILQAKKRTSNSHVYLAVDGKPIFVHTSLQVGNVDSTFLQHTEEISESQVNTFIQNVLTEFEVESENKKFSDL